MPIDETILETMQEKVAPLLRLAKEQAHLLPELPTDLDAAWCLADELGARFRAHVRNRDNDALFDVGMKSLQWISTYRTEFLDDPQVSEPVPIEYHGPATTSVSEDWEQMDGMATSLLEALRCRDYPTLRHGIAAAALVQHRIAEWEKGSNPSKKKVASIKPQSRAIFWLDARTYTDTDLAWNPVEGACSVVPIGSWPGSSSDGFAVFTQGTGIEITFTFPQYASREFMVAVLVRPDINHPEHSVLYSIDTETMNADQAGGSWVLSSTLSDVGLLSDISNDWGVTGHKVSVVDLVSVSKPISVVPVHADDGRFSAKYSTTLSIGPDFSGDILSVSAYHSLATNLTIPSRIEGLLREYGITTPADEVSSDGDSQ